MPTHLHTPTNALYNKYDSDITIHVARKYFFCRPCAFMCKLVSIVIYIIETILRPPVTDIFMIKNHLTHIIFNTLSTPSAKVPNTKFTISYDLSHRK